VTVGTCCVSGLSAGLDGAKLSPSPSGPADSQPRCTRRTNYHIHTSLPPDDGLLASPKHVAVRWLNKLRINSASGWFNYTHTTVLWNILELPTPWLTPHTARLESPTAPLLETQIFKNTPFINLQAVWTPTCCSSLSECQQDVYHISPTVRHTQTVRHTNFLMCVSGGQNYSHVKLRIRKHLLNKMAEQRSFMLSCWHPLASKGTAEIYAVLSMEKRVFGLQNMVN
jgi:hypothetical protein